MGIRSSASSETAAIGFIEYTCQVRGEATSGVVTVTRNADGQAQQIVDRPRSSVLLSAREMGETLPEHPGRDLLQFCHDHPRRPRQPA
jgi:hypothetical protein